MADDNYDIAQRIQEKFDFYLIALTFTVLGFSIQTVKFGKVVYADLAELIAWFLLIISGVLGLRKMMWKASLFRLHYEKDDLKDEEFERSETYHIRKVDRYERIHWWGFVLGIFFLIVSRASQPILSIYAKLHVPIH